MEYHIDDDGGEHRKYDRGEHRCVICEELADEEADSQLQGSHRGTGGEKHGINEFIPTEKKDKCACGNQTGFTQGQDDSPVSPCKSDMGILMAA